VVTFPGFPAETLSFLRGLRANNTRVWFDAHRDQYELFYVTPAREFVVAAGEVLATFAPGVRAEPRILGSIFRVNRDTRFSPDKRPYKDHIDFWFWEGERKTAISGFFLRLAPELVGLGAGCHGFDPRQLAAYRAAACDPAVGRELLRAMEPVQDAGYAIDGVRYQRLPRGFEASAPGNHHLLKYGGLFVHHDLRETDATDGVLLMDACERHWRVLAPLHRWLVDHVQHS